MGNQECCWHLAGGGQGCCLVSQDARDSPHRTELPDPRSPGGEALREVRRVLGSRPHCRVLGSR